jgi:hypothetical protein
VPPQPAPIPPTRGETIDLTTASIIRVSVDEAVPRTDIFSLRSQGHWLCAGVILSPTRDPDKNRAVLWLAPENVDKPCFQRPTASTRYVVTKMTKPDHNPTPFGRGTWYTADLTLANPNNPSQLVKIGRVRYEIRYPDEQLGKVASLCSGDFRNACTLSFPNLAEIQITAGGGLALAPDPVPSGRGHFYTADIFYTDRRGVRDGQTEKTFKIGRVWYDTDFPNEQLGYLETLCSDRFAVNCKFDFAEPKRMTFDILWPFDPAE